MMRNAILTALIAAFTGTMLRAEIADLPALYDVSGLDVGETLNVRAAPELQSEILGVLPASTRLKEIVALNDSGDWGRINFGESAGWVSMKFMKDAGGPRWWARDLPLSCYGTEPFWSAVIFRSDPGSLELEDMSGASPYRRTMALGRFQRAWGNPQWDKPMNAVMSFSSGSEAAIAVIRADACNDGMSDRQFGLSINLFLESGDGASSSGSYLGGCCSIGN